MHTRHHDSRIDRLQTNRTLVVVVLSIIILGRYPLLSRQQPLQDAHAVSPFSVRRSTSLLAELFNQALQRHRLAILCLYHIVLMFLLLLLFTNNEIRMACHLPKTHQELKDGRVMTEDFACRAKVRELGLGIGVQRIVDILFWLGKLEVFNVDLLRRQRNHRVAVDVSHVLCASKHKWLQNRLDGCQCPWVFSFKWQRDKRAPERVRCPVIMVNTYNITNNQLGLTKAPVLGTSQAQRDPRVCSG